MPSPIAHPQQDAIGLIRPKTMGHAIRLVNRPHGGDNRPTMAVTLVKR